MKASDGMAEEIKRLQARVLELEAKVPKWIPVSERLPEDGKTVIINNGKYVTFAVFCVGKWYDPHESQYAYEYTDVIHWMPLPLPPSE